MLKICVSSFEVLFKFIRWICFGLKRLVLTFKLKYRTNSVLCFEYSKELEAVTPLARLTHSCYNSPCFGNFRSFMTSPRQYFFIFHILIFLTLFFS